MLKYIIFYLMSFLIGVLVGKLTQYIKKLKEYKSIKLKDK